MYLVDRCTTNTIVREVRYFQTLTKREGMVLTIAGHDAMIVGSGKATTTLLVGTQIDMEEALLYSDSTRTLLRYSDIQKNRIHVETYEENKEEFILFTKDIGQGKKTLENVPSLQSGLYIKLVPYVHTK